MVRLSVKPRAQTFDDRTGSEVVTLPQAQVTENEKHDYYDANDVEDIIHSDFSPFSTNRRYAYFLWIRVGNVMLLSRPMFNGSKCDAISG